jgi:hypothetical protein
MQIAAEKCQQVDPAREHQGKSEPLFLLYRVRRSTQWLPQQEHRQERREAVACRPTAGCSSEISRTQLHGLLGQPQLTAEAAISTISCFRPALNSVNSSSSNSLCADEAKLLGLMLPVVSDSCTCKHAGRRCRCHSKCRQSFCLQNGQLKAKVSGANVPLLSSSILELTPANAEIDELEVRQPACSQLAATAHACRDAQAMHIVGQQPSSSCTVISCRMFVLSFCTAVRRWPGQRAAGSTHSIAATAAAARPV